MIVRISCSLKICGRVGHLSALTNRGLRLIPAKLSGESPETPSKKKEQKSVKNAPFSTHFLFSRHNSSLAWRLCKTWGAPELLTLNYFFSRFKIRYPNWATFQLYAQSLTIEFHGPSVPIFFSQKNFSYRITCSIEKSF